MKKSLPILRSKFILILLFFVAYSNYIHGQVQDNILKLHKKLMILKKYESRIGGITEVPVDIKLLFKNPDSLYSGINLSDSIVKVKYSHLEHTKKYLDDLKNASEPFDAEKFSKSFYDLIFANDLVYQQLLQRIIEDRIASTEDQLKSIINNLNSTIENSIAKIDTNTKNAISPTQKEVGTLTNIITEFSNWSLGAGIYTKQALGFDITKEGLFSDNIATSASIFSKNLANTYQFGGSINIGFANSNFGILPIGVSYINNTWDYNFSGFIKNNGWMIAIKYNYQTGYGFSILFALREKDYSKSKQISE